MRWIVKFKEEEKIHKVERIDFFQTTFSVFVEESMGNFKAKNDVNVEYIKYSSGELIFPNENHVNSFASAIKNAFISAGGSPKDAEEYFFKNYQ